MPNEIIIDFQNPQNNLGIGVGSQFAPNRLVVNLNNSNQNIQDQFVPQHQGFRIEFDSPTGAYYAGNIISGRVVLNLVKSKDIRAIQIKIQGESKVSFKGEAVVRNEKGETVRDDKGEPIKKEAQFTGSNEIFNFQYNLLGGSSANINLPSGNHVYPFTSTLPSTLPSSFGGKHGSVQYKVIATLNKPQGSDEYVEGVFVVETPYDLNTDLNAKEPINKEVSKTFCCLWCKSGPLEMSVSIPYRGFVPGQNIPISIDIENGSNIAVNDVKMILTKFLTWKAKLPSPQEKLTKKILLSDQLGGVSENSSKHWDHQLIVPSFPFVNLKNCPNIEQQFEISITASVSGPHINLELTMPIVMGSIPLNNVQNPKISPPASGFNVSPPVQGFKDNIKIYGPVHPEDNIKIYGPVHPEPSAPPYYP